MRSQENNIAAQRQLILQHLGIDPTVSRVFEGQVFGRAGAILRLPPEVNAETQDPVTGALAFMVDASAVDGPDPIG